MSSKNQFILHERYLLQSVLGKGGQATVFRAHDIKLKVDRAIKLLSPEMMKDSDIISRFEAEAQVMAQIQHDGIVPLYDIVSTDSHIFLVMDVISGGNLWDWVRSNGPMPEDMVYDTILEVLAAVQALHSNNVIHRDIKPTNMLVNQEGRIKLTDFGIARMERKETQETSTGVVMGTIGYMAPEQLASARLVTVQSDIYAIGATIYALASGTPPKDLVLVEHKPEILAHLSKYLQKLIQKCCAYEPKNRFVNTQQVIDAIHQCKRYMKPKKSNVLSLLEQAQNFAKKPDKQIDEPLSRQLTSFLSQKYRTSASVINYTGIETDVSWEKKDVSPPQSSSSLRILFPLLVIVLVVLVGIKLYLSPSKIEFDTMQKTCREYATELVSNQDQKGGFAGTEQSPSKLWDTGQQFYAMRGADSCGYTFTKEKPVLEYLGSFASRW